MSKARCLQEAVEAVVAWANDNANEYAELEKERDTLYQKAMDAVLELGECRKRVKELEAELTDCQARRQELIDNQDD